MLLEPPNNFGIAIEHKEAIFERIIGLPRKVVSNRTGSSGSGQPATSILNLRLF